MTGHMPQDRARIAKPLMPPSLLDPSDLSVLKALNQKPLEIGDVPAEISSKLTGHSLVRKSLGSLAITGKGQLALARRLYPAAAATAAARASSAVKASLKLPEHVVGAGVTVIGHIVSEGKVEVEGEVQGNVYCKSLVVGGTARISGDLMAKKVVVGGRVTGTIHAEHLMLLATAHVEGEIHHRSLKIEPGSYFEGKSRRVTDPNSSAAIKVALSKARGTATGVENCDTERLAARRAA